MVDNDNKEWLIVVYTYVDLYLCIYIYAYHDNKLLDC